MSREHKAVPIIVHFPTTPEGKASLSQQVASAHAEQVRRYVQSLSCPSEQKRRLVSAILSSGQPSHGL